MEFAIFYPKDIRFWKLSILPKMYLSILSCSLRMRDAYENRYVIHPLILLKYQNNTVTVMTIPASLQQKLFSGSQFFGISDHYLCIMQRSWHFCLFIRVRDLGSWPCLLRIDWVKFEVFHKSGRCTVCSLESIYKSAS